MHWSALAWSLPWIVAPVATAIRARHSRSLDDESATPPDPAPLASVIVPARNEARNIGDCLRAILASTYPALEVIVVDDHSTDATRAIAEDVAASDPRVHVVANPDLPPGWFGKQWACQNGADRARGDILVFVDADTRLGPELITRSVNGMLRRHADLYTVAGRQEMHTFWEKLIQPQIFAVLASRYGGTESVNASPFVADKIANGQYLMIRHSAYDALDGHALVKHHVAEDLMLAQRYFAAGRKTVMILGRNHLSTRMYTSLRELVGGWGKNIFAAGRDAVPFGRLGRIMFPITLPLPGLMQLVPVVALVLALAGVLGTGALVWSAVSTAAMLVAWAGVYRFDDENPLYALAFPLGAAAYLYIVFRATLRGSTVAWKGREYRSGSIPAT
jgi:chlorobactene glucosyltransferase